MTVAHETGSGRDAGANLRQHFVAAGGGHAAGLGEQQVFQMTSISIVVAPRNELQTSPELRFGRGQRMGEEARQQRRVARAFHDLGRSGDQAEDHGEQRRIGQVSGRKVHEEFGPDGQRGASCPVLGRSRREVVQTPDIAEVLSNQGLQ